MVLASDCSTAASRSIETYFENVKEVQKVKLISKTKLNHDSLEFGGSRFAIVLASKGRRKRRTAKRIIPGNVHHGLDKVFQNGLERNRRTYFAVICGLKHGKWNVHHLLNQRFICSTQESSSIGI